MSQIPESREHVSEMCAAFDDLLDSLGTVLEPHRQDDEAAARATARMDRLYAESREARREA